MEKPCRLKKTFGTVLINHRPAGLTERLSRLAQNLRDDVPERVYLRAKYWVSEHEGLVCIHDAKCKNTAVFTNGNNRNNNITIISDDDKFIFTGETLF